MRRHLLAGVAIAALTHAGSALAADLPLKAPPPIAAAWNWSGFYIGGHGGYGWGQDPLTDVSDPFFAGKFPGFTESGFDPKGALGGAQAGVNWQSGRVVAGLEGDISFTDIKGASLNIPTPIVAGTSIFTGSAANSGRFEWLGSDRARLGYVVTPDILLYGTGGLAWTRFVQNSDMTALISSAGPPPGSVGLSSSTSTPSWRFGWVAGVGAEARLFNTNWLARLEYLHYDFGNSSNTVESITSSGVTALFISTMTHHLTTDVVRTSLDYKFD